MKKTFLFLAALAMSAMMWAGEVTMAYSGSTTNMTGDNDAALVGLNADSWSVVGDKGGNGNFPGLNKAGQIRMYGSATNHNAITVTNLDGDNITSIKVTYGDKNYNAKVTVDDAEVTGTGDSNEEKTYAINSTSFTIAHNYSTSTQVYILSIVITTGNSPVLATLEGIVIKGTASKLEYFVGDSFDPAGLEVWGIYTKTVKNDSTSQIKSGFEWTIDPETLALGTTSVNVTAQYKDFTSEVFTVNNIVVKEKPAAKYVPVAWNEIEDGGKYFITANNDGEFYFAAKVFAAKGALAIAFDASMAPEADMWTFTKSGDVWKISTANGAGLYMTNDNNGLVCAADKGADFTVAQGSSAEFTYLSASDGSNTRYISLYGKQDFRCYKSSSTSGSTSDLKLYGLKKEGVVAKPVFTPTASEFDTEVEVTLTAGEGADIYYTLDGTTPSNTSTKYESAFKLTATTTVKAIAIKGGKSSEVAEKTYTLIPVPDPYKAEPKETIEKTLSYSNIYIDSETGETPIYFYAYDEKTYDDIELQFNVASYNLPAGTYPVANTGAVNTVQAATGEIIDYYPVPTYVSFYDQSFNLTPYFITGGSVTVAYSADGKTIYMTGTLTSAHGSSFTLNLSGANTLPLTPTALQNVIKNANTHKAIVNGQIVIVRDNKTYNVLGF